MTILIVLCVLVGCIVAVAGLFRPVLGLLVFLVLHFLQPGELVPMLAPLRVELVYSALLIGLIVLRRKRNAQEKSLFLSDHVLRGALVLVGAAVLSIPFALWRGGAVETVIELIKLVVITVLIRSMIDNDDRLRWLLWCMTAIGAWFAGSSLFAFAAGDYYHLKYNLGNLNRAQGVNSIVGGPNELAGALLALLPLLIALLSGTRSALARLLLLGCGVLSLIALVLTGSRIAIVGLFAIAIFYIFRSKRKLRTATVCLFLGCVLWMAMPAEYRQRYLTVGQYAAGAKLDDSNQLRLQVWTAGWQIFLARPLLGVGAGQFPTGYGVIYLRGRHFGWMQPHNLLIQVACELGIVGLFAFGYFVSQLLKAIAAVLREKNEENSAMNYEVGLACGVMFVGVLILSAVSHTLYRPYWYLLAGMVAANQHIVRAKHKVRDGVTSNAMDIETQNGLSLTEPDAFGNFVEDL
jgi:O-antigen ligase